MAHARYSLVGDVMPLIYQKIGAHAAIVENNVISPAILESVKAVTAQYTAEELVTSVARERPRTGH